MGIIRHCSNWSHVGQNVIHRTFPSNSDNCRINLLHHLRPYDFRRKMFCGCLNHIITGCYLTHKYYLCRNFTNFSFALLSERIYCQAICISRQFSWSIYPLYISIAKRRFHNCIYSLLALSLVKIKEFYLNNYINS